MTKEPNIAMLAAERRVRMLETASKTDSSGVTRMSGTAHGRVLTGSKLKPVLAPEAAPDAAAAMLPTVIRRFSANPPVQQSRRRA